MASRGPRKKSFSSPVLGDVSRRATLRLMPSQRLPIMPNMRPLSGSATFFATYRRRAADAFGEKPETAFMVRLTSLPCTSGLVQNCSEAASQGPARQAPEGHSFREHCAVQRRSPHDIRNDLPDCLERQNEIHGP